MNAGVVYSLTDFDFLGKQLITFAFWGKHLVFQNLSRDELIYVCVNCLLFIS